MGTAAVGAVVVNICLTKKSFFRACHA